MRVFKWSPTFTPDHESSIVPIWVSLPELPAHLFQKAALYAIANNIGTPLQIADSTYNKSNLSKARVCVEIDILKPPLEEIDIKICGATIVQKIEYEQVPHYCSLCKHIGHQESECYSKGNAPNPPPPPPPCRRMDRKNEAIDENAHKRQQKMKGKVVVQHARKVLDNFPVRNDPSVLMEKGEPSLFVDASPDECEIIGKNYEDNAIHEGHTNDNGVTSDHCDNGVTSAENEITHVENNTSTAENNISTAENENANGDVVCIAEYEAVFTSGKGEENGLHVVGDASIRVGDDVVNAIHCVENAKVIEETGIVEKEEAEVTGKEVQQLIQAVKPLFPEFLRRGKSLKWIKIKDVIRLLQNLKQFGVVSHVIQYAESDDDDNSRTHSTGIPFDSEIGDQGVPSPERPSPIASRTKCRKKGKKAPEGLF
ncbi:UNVERIFIED_CONTAM: hypothetical protein Sradi_6764800 [Sesamum radiatum]|uniref:DUF4283 domain-containing protein n=1 Tax=Sesamum radiatum TaxID=300843 RepID=A0AAW2JTA5_SESRA